MANRTQTGSSSKGIVRKIQKESPSDHITSTVSPKRRTLKDIRGFRPDVKLNFSTKRMPYRDLWRDYGVVIKGNMFQQYSGYDQSNYTKARRNERRINAANLIAACLLSRVTVQQAYDIFHLCQHTDELTAYGNEAIVLTHLLDDMHTYKTTYSYDELIWYTLMLDEHIPEIHKKHRQWIKMKHEIDSDQITLMAVRKRAIDEGRFPDFKK